MKIKILLTVYNDWENLKEVSVKIYEALKNTKWKNANSQIFLEYAMEQLTKEQYQISNIDINIILQKPTINKYIHKIKNNLSNIININNTQISVKATTTDFLGYIGENKGIAVHAVILINNNES